MASQIIQQAMSIMNQQNADVDADGNLNANYDQGTTDDGYAQMLTQLEEQKNSFKNQYRRDIEQLGLNKKTGGAMQNAQNGTGKVANKFWTREKTSAIFNEFLGQGYSAKEARNNIYNMNVISEKDYDFVKGLGSKNKKLKKGGSADTVELTTQQIAQIMAAGGSVKYV